MTKETKEIQLTEQINQLIEQNKDDVFSYLEKQLVKFRKIFSSEILNPWYLCFVLNIKIIRNQNLDFNTKTILKFEETTSYIYYNSQLNDVELNLCLMKELIYHLITLHILPSEFRFETFFMNYILLHSTTNSGPQNECDATVEQIIHAFALEFLMPEEIFDNYYAETKNLERCSEYFGVEEKVIESYLENKEKIKSLKKEKLS